MKRAFNFSKKVLIIIQKIFIGIGSLMVLLVMEHVSKNDLFITTGWIKWTVYWSLVVLMLFLVGHAIKDFEMKSRGERQ